MEELYFEKIETPDDIEQLKDWLSDPELLKLARMRDNPLTEDEFQVYLDTLSYMVYVDGLAIGYGRIFKMENPEELEIGVVIANPDYRGKKIGETIARRLMEASRIFNPKRFFWCTADYNLPSVNLAKRLGFKFHKLIPEIVKIGRESHDALVYVKEAA
jgi:RimJ/RimL family protein N-acetyltransferase